MPGDKIPNSTVSKALGMLDATATLIYAKTLNRKARFARPGECQYTMELEKERMPKASKPDDGLLSTLAAAKILEVHPTSLSTMRIAGKVEAEKIGGRYFFKPEEVERLRIQRAIDKI
ncbi:hypothetical protein JOE44_001973 [Chryseobacterium sp. PvR013]|nr:hypothetical protein [Chryseobacterium sp. PvR013]